MDMVSITCCHTGCGVTWWMTAGFDAQRHRDHKDFYCPSGHAQNYAGMSDADKLARAQRNLSHCRTQVDRLESELNKTPCPYCQKRFTDVNRHIKRKHPGKAMVSSK